ncbi:hypothetical protein SFRURICE_002537 [Spodoptera frugiperda]|uniref:Uncharacterized protein LOC118272497 isoform X3 n=1 Tax=Spodoptera frugiperda TaxID=7108 RepID=A0A9R0EMG1_SPOFR|nr:uncharacterized protein LOC118272497 isoform X3 [Spodoptera frugiperda]KAF9811168.1 hypothetical protein SFRURICE_002537 [Spodoptera frugiperda]
MDLAETMKSVLAKSTGTSSGAASTSSSATPHGAEGYVTEKLYMLLQLYLQNKGWSPSIELLQCFSDLKESSMLPSAAYLQMMASRVGLDTQGRLILRENGKIILPYEHFANAVMLKHMNGPHGLHLGLEATVRAVVESYTIGREQFGMEKEFIIEVVQNCPNPACRYYKNQLEMTQKSIQQHLSQQPTYIPASLTGEKSDRRSQDKLSQHQQMLLQHQNRSLGHQSSIDKYSHSQQRSSSSSQASLETKSKHHYSDEHKLTDFLRANLESLESLSGGSGSGSHGERGGAGSGASGGGGAGGQERVVRAFAELARNLQRMRPCVRPAMCKPYGKQSEQLQKILLDTIQLVQSLRSYLPPPHIQVTSWKNDDKLRSNNMEEMESRKIVSGN